MSKNKTKMCVKIIENDNSEEITKAELLRYRAFGLPEDIVDNDYSFYYMQIANKRVLPYAFYVNDRMVAGCYVSNFCESIHIDQLFVMPEAQDSGIGTLLHTFVMHDKERIEEFFNQKFTRSTIEPISKRTKSLYERLGYQDSGYMMKKKI